MNVSFLNNTVAKHQGHVVKSGRLNYGGEDTAMGRLKKAHTCSMVAVV